MVTYGAGELEFIRLRQQIAEWLKSRDGVAVD
jgi:hypothetical protein